MNRQYNLVLGLFLLEPRWTWLDRKSDVKDSEGFNPGYTYLHRGGRRGCPA